LTPTAWNDVDDQEPIHPENTMRDANRIFLAGAATLAGLAALVQPSWAERHEERGEHRFRGDIGRFHEHDWALWREGRWYHSSHEGRFGWWWVAGGLWYFYPSPIYPYPNPYEPPVAVIVPQAPATPAPPPPPPQNWYYCDASRAYYPYVPTCPGGWRAVPATPSTEPPAPSAPPR
jgi:hypothetical protein